jgi:predicted regulator of Ras-like GTPase activity (Roadblock/LC7/MglB family)
MDATQALADLMEISSQVRSAVLVKGPAGVEAATGGGEGLGDVASGLLERAARVRSQAGDGVTQLEVATREGSVFVVRDGDTVIAATTDPAPTVGLVFYDLKTCLRSLAREEENAAPKRGPRTRAAKAPKPDKAATAEQAEDGGEEA